MSPARPLREFISARLTAAAEEIFLEFEKTIVQYEEVIDRQRKLLDISWRPDIKLDRTDLQHPYNNNQLGEDVAEQELDSSLDPEQAEVKEEVDELLPVQEEEQQLPMKDEQNDSLTNEEKEQSDPVANVEHAPFYSFSAEEYSYLEENLPDIKQPETNQLEGESIPLESIKNDHPTDDISPTHINISNSMSRKTVRSQLKKYPCKTCGKKFQTTSKVTIHMRTHTGERPFSCQTCGKSFSQNCDMVRHMKTHTGERPYACSVCGKSFSRQHILVGHLRTHTGEKPFACEMCGLSFSKNNALLWHIRSHTGEKPFTCKLCGKSFHKNSNLSSHMKIHSGEKPYVCQTCAKPFSQNSDLMRHLRTHTGEKPYSCKTCKKSFSRHNTLVAHMKTHTSGTLILTKSNEHDQCAKL